MSTPRPPAQLSRESRRLWRDLQQEYAIRDAAGLLLLTQACEALDRLRQAQAAIEQDGGPVGLDRYGKPKAHPAVRIEQDARNQLLACLKALNLDIEPLKAIGRPPGR